MSDPVRRANLIDIMILIAASAFGFMVVRYYIATPVALIPTIDKRGVLSFVPRFRAGDLRELATIGSLLLAAWSPALVWAGLRSPRAYLGAMSCRPGVLAPAVATAVVIAFLGWHLRGDWPAVDIPGMSGGQLVIHRLDLFPIIALAEVRRKVGPAVVAAWLTLVASGRWRGSADWTDRPGLAIGTGWILVYVESLF